MAAATDLSGRVFAVTGASGNLGGAVAQALAGAGARRVLLDRRPHGEAGDDALRAAVDLTDPTAIGAALRSAAERFGRLDGLVATVGAYGGGPRADEPGWQPFEAMLTANFKTAVAACQAIAPHLTAGGRIVTVGARPGVTAGKGVAAYAASKAALLRFTESLADELRDRGITVNAVMPSTIDTPQNRAAMPKADFSRLVPPGDVANVILFLLSDAARSVTGALIPVYGRA
jgi:NAD(P)-dependent dehydrogenase (short-subunit alcohol dehydrogenase family)